MSENYFDGAWRPVLDMSDSAITRLRNRGFELGADTAGRLVARWPARPALPLDGLPLAYWREEARLGCAASLARLRRICEQRGCDYDRTMEEARDGRLGLV